MALPGRTGQCGLAAGRSVADPEDPGADAGGRRNALRLCRSFLNTSIAYQRHISSRRKSEHCPQKANIEDEKANIEEIKANIESPFTPKTACHIYKLLKKIWLSDRLRQIRCSENPWPETDQKYGAAS